jgi:hypothetical protein
MLSTGGVTYITENRRGNECDEGDKDKEESVTSDCVPKTMGRNHIEHWCVEGSRVRPRGLTWHDGRALHTSPK